MTQYTPNYDLDLYEDSDKPNLRDQYNSAMGKIDTALEALANSDVSINNLISGINRDIKNIEDAQSSLTENVEQLQTLTGTHSNQIESLNSSVSQLTNNLQSATEDITENTTKITTISGYLTNLGITSDESAQSLAMDISENTQDIATIKPQISTLQSDYQSAETAIDGLQTTQSEHTTQIDKLQTDVSQTDMNWSVSSVGVTTSLVGRSDYYFFINPEKTLFKICGDANISAKGSVSLDPIAGTSYYGFKVADLRAFMNNFQLPMTIKYVGLFFRVITETTSYVHRAIPVDFVIANDGYLYAAFSTSQNVSFSANETQQLVIVGQPIITTSNYDFTPTIPESD